MFWRKRVPPPSDWSRLELAPWQCLPAGTLEDELREEVARRTSAFLVEIRDRRVTVHDKGDQWPQVPGLEPWYDSMRYRAETYLRFLQAAQERRHGIENGFLVLDLDDLHDSEPAVPVFAFQKRRGTRRLLLPDVDSVALDFYTALDVQDPLAFAKKAPRAVFVGSTTGDLPITARHVAERLNARLRAALFFRDDARVDFDLPEIVQCDSPETAEMIRALPIGRQRRNWQEQFRYRYLLSMDGNGATCSRMGIALHSHCALIKYESEHELHYFKGLIPGFHYLSARNDDDVAEHLDRAGRDRRHHARIAARATRFARRVITRDHALSYTAALLDGYLARFGDGVSSPAGLG